MSIEKLNNLDNFILKTESKNLTWTVALMWTFEKSIDVNSLTDLFQNLVEEFPRFKSRPVGDHFWWTHSWEKIKDFNVSDCIEAYTLPLPGSKDELEAYFGKVIEERFDLSRALWRCYVVYGLDGGQGSAVIIKAHHCITDGEGFMRAALLASLGWEKLEQAFKIMRDRLNTPKPKPSELPILRLSFIRPHVNRIPSGLIDTYLFLLQIFSIFTWIIAGFVNSLKLTALLLFTSRKNFRCDLNTHQESSTRTKRISWSDEISIDDIRIPRKAFNASLNDVMVATVIRAIRKYLVEINRIKDNDIVLFIPLSMRKVNDFRCENIVSGAFTPFPFVDLTTKQLIKAVHKKMSLVKCSIFPVLIHAIGEKLIVPGLTSKTFNDWLTSWGHGVLTNVPGPAIPITVAGQTVQRFFALPPQNTYGSLGMGILSYNNKLSFCVLTDDLIEYPLLARRVSKLFNEEFNRIVADAKIELERIEKGIIDEDEDKDDKIELLKIAGILVLAF
ncbi:13203_t:CDS:2, partial [Ambispora leptoticha]